MHEMATHSASAMRCTSTTAARLHRRQRRCRRQAHDVTGCQLTDADARHLVRAADLADSSAGLCAPHPKSGCVLVDRHDTAVAEAYQFGQGGTRAEVLAAKKANGAAAGGTAYLNLEPAHGPCAGEWSAVDALVHSGVSRIVIGLPHPLPRLRGHAITALEAAGITVHAMSPGMSVADSPELSAAWMAVLRVNEALLHRVALGLPFSVWKYAMTLDGKIASSTGHSAWVTGPVARERVYTERARSDAIIIGGRTLRHDNPRLTTRRHGGHSPARVVISRTMDLPEVANLWDVSVAPTIVLVLARPRIRRIQSVKHLHAAVTVQTKTGVRRDFQTRLASRGVEVLQFDNLTLDEVLKYCQSRGYLQCFWECGGNLAAPAVAAGLFHKVYAFIAPKLIGGDKALGPLGEIGLLKMTDALPLHEPSYDLFGPDMLISGYLPPSGGLVAAAERCYAMVADDTVAPAAVRFYKAWDEYGTLSNFSPHPIVVSHMDPECREWQTVEAFYQAQKFAGVQTSEARDVYRAICAAATPEAAAAIGRAAQRSEPQHMRPDWDVVKWDVMRAALRSKFERHEGARTLLLSTGDATLIEDSPHDNVWGVGRDGSGANMLGKFLMQLRDELRRASA